MATVTFQCGHCNQLMGVSDQYLGQQVQCPHCRQVVVAPSSSEPAPSPPPAPAPAPSPFAPSLFDTEPTPPPISLDHIHEQESIFSEPNPDDDIFGGQDVPQLGSPEPEVLSAEPEIPMVEMVDRSAPPQPDSDQTQPYGFAPSAPSFGQETAAFVDEAPAQGSPGGHPWDQPADSHAAPISGTEGFGSTLSPTSQRATKAAAGSGIVSTLLMVPLISYSVLATILLLVMWNRVQKTQSGPADSSHQWLEKLPDVNGDRPGVQKDDRQASIRNLDKANEVSLPDNLKVKLNETLQIGDVEITPLGVEQKKVNIFVEGYARPEPCLHDSLVLNLRIKNTSDQYTFAPLDNYFDRHYKGGTEQPLTLLEVGRQRIVGGPAHWRPLGRELKGGDKPREWIEGRGAVFPYLAPGKSIETFVCTDGAEETTEKIVARHRGDYLWRVHLRRGPVDVEGRTAPVPATAVVGVEFSPDQIARP